MPERVPNEYVGRFAPSPTGPLHFGSLLAALASYLEARRQNGKWLLRIEDIDPPREQPGAADAIRTALERYGFEWDEPLLYQSSQHEAHRAALRVLSAAGQTYPCSCSRRDLADEPRGPLGAIYPGTCRNGAAGGDVAIRVRTGPEPVKYNDRLQGPKVQRLDQESGDFVVWRRDGLAAYQLAVVVDDNAQGITEVVRGIDLMDSTPRQIWLHHLLGNPVPAFCHIPVVVNAAGQKLSKQTGAPGIPLARPAETLAAALACLRQTPPRDLADADLDDVWAWAAEHWDIAVLRGQTTLSAP